MEKMNSIYVLQNVFRLIPSAVSWELEWMCENETLLKC